jgi:tripartite-type tricarboxylate transporter receptor subunit TctC
MRVTTRMHRLLLRSNVTLLLAALTATVGAQTYPQRPLRLVVGFPAGGTSDIVARALADQLARGLAQTVVVDNRPGAGGNIATELAARAAPDGHTLFLASGSSTLAPALYDRLGYDFERDFAQVSVFAGVSFLLVVTPGQPIRSVEDLLALARTRPRELNFASPGIGTPSHLAGELFGQMAGVELVHIPYKGTAPALVDLLAGRVQIYFTSIPGVLTHVRAGRVRAIAVSGTRRTALMPELPTVDEAGVKGYQSGSWYGLAAPARTPAAIVGRLHGEVQKGLASAELRAKFLEQGLDLVEGVTPQAATAYVRDDIARWRKVVQIARIRGG